MNSNQLCVFKTRGKNSACKTIDLATSANDKDYDNSKNFTCKIEEIDNINQLSVLLSELNDLQNKFVVIGELTPDYKPGTKILRNGETLITRDIKFLPLDIDGVDIGPHDPNSDNPQDVKHRVLERVGLGYFSEYSCVFSYTAKAGTDRAKGMARCRAWFLLEDPVAIELLRAWSEQFDGIDSAILHPVQTIYTAAPIFTRGDEYIPDILKQRVFLLSGDKGDELPVEQFYEVTPVEKKSSVSSTGPSEPVSASEHEAIKEALSYIPADCPRETWIHVLAGLHDRFGGSDDGLTVADDWSRQGGEKYQGVEDVSGRWNSFIPGKGVTIATVFHLAEKHGAPITDITAQYELEGIKREIEELDIPIDCPTVKEFKTKFKLAVGSEGYDKKIKFVIGGHVPVGALASVFGKSGTGKSFIVIDWACHIAAGKEWQGYETTHGNVLYVVGEGGIGVPKRIRAWELKNHNGQALKNLHRIDHSIAPKDESIQKEVVKLVNWIESKTGKPVVLIVLDTLARCFGGENENDASAMSSFVAGCDEIRKRTSASVVVVHHTGKDEQKGSRGSSALPAALDAEFFVQEGSEGPLFSCTKMKDAAKPTPRKFRFRSVGIDTPERDETSLVLELENADEFEARIPPSENEQIILDALTAFGDPDAWVQRVDLKEASIKKGMKERTFASSIIRLLNKEHLEKKNDTNKQVFFRRAPAWNEAFEEEAGFM